MKRAWAEGANSWMQKWWSVFKIEDSVLAGKEGRDPVTESLKEQVAGSGLPPEGSTGTWESVKKGIAESGLHLSRGG